MTIHIIQHGTDGFGHQLEGLFTCLILHNVKNYYFDGIEFMKKQFSFEHVDENQMIILKDYLIEVISQFINEYDITKKIYKDCVRSHELWKIPSNYHDDTLYSLDNVFFYKKFFLDNKDIQKINQNMNKMKDYFINSKLAPNRLDEKSIVIHIRLGDATNRTGSNEYLKKIIGLIDILKIKYKDYKYYIHSDGYPKDIIDKINSNYIFYNRDTPVLTVLSDLIHSNILICGNSSLSMVCSYLGNKELIIIPDNNDRSITNDNLYTISKYLNNNLTSFQPSVERANNINLTSKQENQISNSINTQRKTRTNAIVETKRRRINK